MTKLRDCEVCREPVPRRRDQADTARTCSPACAKALAVKEHPEIESHLKSNRWHPERIDVGPGGGGK